MKPLRSDEGMNALRHPYCRFCDEYQRLLRGPTETARQLKLALAEDREKWSFDTLMAVGDALLEDLYPEGVPLISEGEDPGPRLVRAVRDCRAAMEARRAEDEAGA